MLSKRKAEDRLDHRAPRRSGFLSLAAVGLVAAGLWLLLAACGTQSTAPATGKTAVVRISSVQPLTGPSAAYGLRAQSGAELAVKEINAAGGFKDDQGNSYTIELGKGDMANDRNEAIALLRQAAGDPNILAQTGPCSSVGFVPSVPVAGQVKLPLIGAGSVAPIKDWNIYTVRVNPVASTAMPVLVRSMAKKLNAKKWALIVDQTQDGQVGSYEASKKTIQELGLQIVADSAFRTGDSDFSAQISRTKAGNPDIIGIFAAEGDGGKLTLQIRDAGITAPMFTPDGAFLNTSWWDVSRGAIKDGFTWLAQDLESGTGGLKKFLDDYTKAYPDLSPTQYSTYGYDAIYTIVAGIKKAGSGTDREKLQKALASLDYTTPLGTRVVFKNPPDGENQNPTVKSAQITDRGKYARID